MAEIPSQTSQDIVRALPHPRQSKNVKLNQVMPVDPAAKATEEAFRKDNQIFVSIPTNNYLHRGQHTQLEKVFHVKPKYSLGAFLSKIELIGMKNEHYTCQKTSRFPYSRFCFNETDEKLREFVLVSNFIGSIYNLYCEDQIILTIVFQTGCTITSTSRRFCLYGLPNTFSYNSLTGFQAKIGLDELYSMGQNNHKIVKYCSIEPKVRSQDGSHRLEFARKCIFPAVENSAIINHQGQQMLQMYKIVEDDSIFQICCSKKIPMEWSFAYALASLDFKIAIE